MLLRTAPAKGTTKWSSYMAGMLGATTETTWPRRTLREEREEASWRQRRWVWDQVKEVLFVRILSFDED